MNITRRIIGTVLQRRCLPHDGYRCLYTQMNHPFPLQRRSRYKICAKAKYFPVTLFAYVKYSQFTGSIFSTGHFNVKKMGKKGKKAKANSAGNPDGQKMEKLPISKVPSNIHLVTIGTGGPGSPRGLLLATEHSRFMFNCGEGSQRLIVMDKTLRRTAFAKLSNSFDNIFITHKSWDTMGGLLGLVMSKFHSESKKASSDDHEVRKLSLYGPEGIEKIMTMTRQFADAEQHMYLNIVRKTDDFEDAAFKISPLIFRSELSDTQEETEEGAPSLKRRRTCSKSSEDGVHIGREVYGYLCKIKPQPPKINVEKCVDAGVTIGPMVGQLQRGFSVTLDDGTVVHPSQVTEAPNSVERPFLVIDCPDKAFFPSLEQCTVLKQYRQQIEGENEESLSLVVHMTPADILNAPYYRTWMEGFGTNTDHLVMNEDASSANVTRIREYQAHLNVVNNEVFPMILEKHHASTTSLEKTENDIQNTPVKSLRTACYGLKYTFRGKQLGFSMEIDDEDLTALHEQIEVPAMKSELEALKQITSSGSADDSACAEYPKIVFLGTGSSQPSVYRNQSFILVHMNEKSSLILDCGEDSYGQLYRFYGHAETKNVLCKIKAIFVSHLHGDHHLGLVTLLQERQKAFEDHSIPFEPVILLVPIQIRRWLRFYQHEIGQISHLFRCFYHQKDLQVTDSDSVFNVISEDFVLENVGLKEYTPVKVIHSKHAHGVAMTLNSDFKLVYSGDTRPCPELAEKGKDCDLLIHEATHDDTLHHLAMDAKHSTFSEAMDIGAQMKAKHIVLTHFSQRYTYMVPMPHPAPSNVGIAFDNMQISPKNITWLPKFIPALTMIFQEKLIKINKNIQSRSRNSCC